MMSRRHKFHVAAAVVVDAVVAVDLNFSIDLLSLL